MLTNCPNCGAPLTKDGWCDYCKTKVRLANLMEVSQGYYNQKPVEILLKINNLDGTITYMPFIGMLTEIDVQHRCEPVYFDNIPHYISNEPDIQLTLNGHLCKLPEAERSDIVKDWYRAEECE